MLMYKPLVEHAEDLNEIDGNDMTVPLVFTDNQECFGSVLLSHPGKSAGFDVLPVVEMKNGALVVSGEVDCVFLNDMPTDVVFLLLVPIQANEVKSKQAYTEVLATLARKVRLTPLPERRFAIALSECQGLEEDKEKWDALFDTLALRQKAANMIR
jgi:hypothetical protein